MLSNKERHDTTKLGSSVVQEFKINQRRILIDSLEIGIPAPEQMIALGERQLPNGVKVGQLLNSKTLNYKKFTPHRDGLFCERIFGPVQSFVCACGKKKENVQSKIKQKDIAKANLLPPAAGGGMLKMSQNKSSLSSKNHVSATAQTEVSFCPKCQVEYISKNVRRHRLGYIKLFAPVTHIWYLKGRPSYLSLFLGKRKKAITSLAYCNAYLVEQVYSDLKTPNLLKDTDKSASVLVRKGNVRTWQNSPLDDANIKNEKATFLKDSDDSLFSASKAKYNLDLPLSSKSTENSDLDLNKVQTITERSARSSSKLENKHLQMQRPDQKETIFHNNENHRNNLYKTQKDFKNQISLTDSYSKSFISLLVQLFPETVTQKLQTNSKDLLGVSLELDSEQVKTVRKQSQERLKYKVSTKLEAVKYFLETALAATNQNFDNSKLFSVKRDKLKVLRTPYIRAQALPFLPSLICSFHLRDCLISFLQSLPCTEDIPIPTYCQTPRRYPLRDVHKFLAELRSTNTSDQAERLTSESITKFIGPALRTLHARISGAYANQRNSQNSVASEASHVSRLHTNIASAHSLNFASLVSTSSLQPFKEYPLNSCASSAASTSLFKKEHRHIVVHKSGYTNLFSQSKTDAFTSVESKHKNRAYTTFTRENKADKIREFPVIQDVKWGKKGAFTDLGTRINKRIFTPNGLGVGHIIKNTINLNVHQAVTKTNKLDLSETKLFLQNSCSQKRRFCMTYKDFPFLRNKIFESQLVHNATVPEREIKRYKSRPKLVLLPLNLNIVASSTLPHKNIGMSLPWNKKCISKGVVLDAKHSTNQLLYPERSFYKNLYKNKAFGSNLSTPIQRLAKDTGMSLRGALLNTFFGMIKAKFVGLLSPFSVEQFQTNGVKRVKLHNQQKQIVISPNSETVITSKQANTKREWLDSKILKLALSEVQVKARQNLITQKQIDSRLGSSSLSQWNASKNEVYTKTSFLYAQANAKTSFLPLLTNNKIFAKPLLWDDVHKQSQLSLGFSDNKTAHRLNNSKNSKSNSLQLDYNRVLPQSHTKLFTRVSNKTGYFEKKEKLFRHLLEQRKEIKYKYKKFTYTYIPTLLYAREFHFYKNQVGSTGILFQLSPLRYKYRYGLTLNVPNKASTESDSCNRDDGIVHNAFDFQNVSLNGLKSNLQTFFLRKRIDTYQARLLHIVFTTLPKGLLLNQLTPAKTSFLHKNEVLIHNQNKALFGMSEFGYTYLLTKDQQEQKQEILFKNKVNIKTKFWYVCLQSRGKDAMKKQGLYLTSKSPLARMSKQIRAKTVFLHKLRFCTRTKTTSRYKLDYLATLKGRDKLNEREKTKWDSNGVKAFAEFNPTIIGKVQSNLSVPEKVFIKPSANLAKNSLYKIHLNPVELSKSKPIFTKQGTDTSTSFGSETISKWHINGAKEILLYTGGGALESLLKRFNTSLFCQFLLGEVQILRKHYKDQIVVEHNKNKIVAEHSFNALRTNSLDSKDVRSVLSKHNFGKALSLSSSSIATEHTLNHKERHLGVKYVVTDKSANLFCRRIYRTTRRLKIVQLLMRSKRRPEWMMISVLPVLPPDLRPVLQMGDNLIVASDLNTLYQRVIYRNNRHYKGRFLDFHFVSSIHRLVQDAVDRLIENGKGGSTPFLTPGGRPLKSLSDILKGKRGRFRFNLLGKRVDFSGRSVIVVDPNLKIHECGLPKEMALELYKYLLIRQLLLQKRVSSIVNAKKLIKQRKPFIWDILRQIIYYHPLLLNRAPTLHRLGIQAFQPKLTLGNAILLHPLVCAGFNADFDGDQMGVHLPLSPQARAEAWDLLWSRNNLLSPATGQPILLPSQDMVLGFYYMTSLLPYGTTNKANATRTKNSLVSTRSQKISDMKTRPSSLYNNFVLENKEKLPVKNDHNFVVLNKKSKNKVNQVVVHVFSDPFKVLYAYQNKQIDIHTPIWLKWTGKSENGEKSQTPLELRLNAFGDRTQIYPTHKSKNKVYKGVNASFLSFHIRTTVGRVLVNNLIRKNY